MIDALVGILVILGPTYLCCAAALAWSFHSVSRRLARILLISGIGWATLLTLALLVLAIPPVLCDGSALYGFGNCSGISDPLAQALTSGALVCFLIGIGNGVLLLVGGGIWEVVARTRDG